MAKWMFALLACLCLSLSACGGTGFPLDGPGADLGGGVGNDTGDTTIPPFISGAEDEDQSGDPVADPPSPPPGTETTVVGSKKMAVACGKFPKSILLDAPTTITCTAEKGSGNYTWAESHDDSVSAIAAIDLVPSDDTAIATVTITPKSSGKFSFIVTAKDAETNTSVSRTFKEIKVVDQVAINVYRSKLPDDDEAPVPQGEALDLKAASIALQQGEVLIFEVTGHGKSYRWLAGKKPFACEKGVCNAPLDSKLAVFRYDQPQGSDGTALPVGQGPYLFGNRDGIAGTIKPFEIAVRDEGGAMYAQNIPGIVLSGRVLVRRVAEGSTTKPPETYEGFRPQINEVALVAATSASIKVKAEIQGGSGSYACAYWEAGSVGEGAISEKACSIDAAAKTATIAISLNSLPIAPTTLRFVISETTAGVDLSSSNELPPGAASISVFVRRPKVVSYALDNMVTRNGSPYIERNFCWLKCGAGQVVVGARYTKNAFSSGNALVDETFGVETGLTSIELLCGSLAAIMTKKPEELYKGNPILAKRSFSFASPYPQYALDSPSACGTKTGDEGTVWVNQTGAAVTGIRGGWYHYVDTVILEGQMLSDVAASNAAFLPEVQAFSHPFPGGVSYTDACNAGEALVGMAFDGDTLAPYKVSCAQVMPQCEDGLGCPPED